MIGVCIPDSGLPAVREFFELNKTAWQPARPGESYEVLYCDGRPLPGDVSARLVLHYSPAEDGATTGRSATTAPTPTQLRFDGRPLPIYSTVRGFDSPEGTLLTDEQGKRSLLSIQHEAARTVIRVGFSLLAELGHLLTQGQPVAQGAIPTLDHQIDLFRQLIIRSGRAYVEIPPSPPGHPCIACLTHDVDHPTLRSHRFDHTMTGFLGRATLGSALAFARGRLPAARLWRNLGAAAKLPFVLAGWARDPWLEFDRYLDLEGGRPSTFFIIPEGGNPGRPPPGGTASPLRAARYSLTEVSPVLDRIRQRGGEIALHGIDAWSDDAAAARERELIEAAAGPVVGTRMHWLHFDPASSPRHLESGGFSYDSTVGYNGTVGFRAGTTQVFQPPGVERLLELPLHIMDTSLFYPAHLGLTEAQARERVQPILAHATERGGVVTVNWHDRSIAPERQWGEFYVWLVDALAARGAWFATARQTVDWFRQRRAAQLETVPREGRTTVRVSGTTLDSSLPGLTIRLHRPCPPQPGQPLAGGPLPGFTDTPLTNSAATLSL